MPPLRLSTLLRSGPQSDAPPKERRNLRTRANLSLLSRSGGPVRFWALGVIIALTIAAIIAWRAYHPARPETPVIAFSELSAGIAANQMKEIVVDEGSNRVVATLRARQLVYGKMTDEVAANVPPHGMSVDVLERWSKFATVRVAESGGLRSPEAIIQLLSFAALLGMIAFVVVRSRSGGTRTRFLATPPSRRLTLDDVGGAREAQADLKDVIAYLKRPERFRSMGAKCPKGILLVGPPGTGKTLLARAVAGEAGVPVITAAGSDFNEMYVGVGSKRVRQLAKQARDNAPCIVFIDEFDSLGGRRGRPNRSGEEEVTLNQLLVEMDGMAGSEGIVWMAATNREDMLDPAVKRPGRFDRVVEVTLPTANDRLEILKIHAKQSKLAPDVDLERLSVLTVGHSGAELANLLNEAAIIAVHADSPVITNAHIEQARDKILLGRVRAGVTVNPEERRLIALHEAGHAVVGLVACPQDKLHKVTIEPRGRTMGAAHFAPDVDRHLHTKKYLLGVIAKALGGRAAEVVFVGDDAVTSGAGGDLVQATNVARRMVAEFGMSSEVGLINAEASGHNGQPSSGLTSQIDAAVRALIREQAEIAESLVRKHRDAVEAVATALLEKDVLSADEVVTIAREHGVVFEQQLSAA